MRTYGHAPDGHLAVTPGLEHLALNIPTSGRHRPRGARDPHRDQGYHSLSLDAPAPDGARTATLADVVGGPDQRLDHILDIEVVRPLRARLGERDRHILALRFFGGCTQQEIVQDVGVTQMHVTRLITQALTRLRHEVGVDA